MKRTDLKLGYSCNNNCRFCIIGDRRYGVRDKSINQIKRELAHFKNTGTEKILLTGGEPTIRNDILKIISYAKELDFKKIHVESNGRLFSYSNFVDKVIEAGATDFSISLHADTAELYSYITNTNEVSFEQAVEGIKNLSKKTSNLCVNTTIMKPNYERLAKIVSLINQLGVMSINFPYVNPYGRAWQNKQDIVPKLSDVEPFLIEAITLAKNNKMNVTTEMMPFCFLQNHISIAAEYHPRDIQIAAPDYFESDFVKSQTSGKVKGNQCLLCKYADTCAGVMGGYARIFGTSELKPFYDENKISRYLTKKLQNFNIRKLKHQHNIVFDAVSSDSKSFIIKFYKHPSPNLVGRMQFFSNSFKNNRLYFFPNFEIFNDGDINFSVMDKVEGVLLSDLWPSLNDEGKIHFVREMAQILAKLHSYTLHPPENTFHEGLKQQNFKAYLTDRVNNLIQRLKVKKILTEESGEKILNHLNKHVSLIPNHVELSLVHCEFRPEHLIVNKNKISSLIDVETMNIGFKELDVNQAELYLEPEFREVFISEYRKQGYLRGEYEKIRTVYLLLKLLDHSAINQDFNRKFDTNSLLEGLIDKGDEGIFKVMFAQ